MASREFSSQFKEVLHGLQTDMAKVLSVLRDQRRMYMNRSPPLPEQRAIAHVLGTLDDKIELNRRMNETLEQMTRALFKSWFVDFDPVRAKMEGRWRARPVPPRPAGPPLRPLSPAGWSPPSRARSPRRLGIVPTGDRLTAKNVRLGDLELPA